MAEKRLRQDFVKLSKDPPAGISAEPSDSDILRWKAIICGPENTPFEGGIFKLSLQFKPDYPATPPKVTFLSKMFHPNVYRNGRVCLDILEEPSKWSPDIGVIGVLCGVQAVLGDPNPESPANSEANQLFLTEPKVYEQIVTSDIVERTFGVRDKESDDENENLEDALRHEEMEAVLNEIAITQLQNQTH